MTTDARALIEEGRAIVAKLEAGFGVKPVTSNFLPKMVALLTGYSAALDEAERLTSDPMYAAWCNHPREMVRELIDDRDAARTSIGELKLVLEQQDRDLARMHEAQSKLVARIAATDSPVDIETTLTCLGRARSRIAKLEAGLAEARLVIENQNQMIVRLQRKPPPVVDVDIDDGPIL